MTDLEHYMDGNLPLMTEARLSPAILIEKVLLRLYREDDLMYFFSQFDHPEQ